MEDKERKIIDDIELTETAEMLYNFRDGMTIEGIKSILWQQANHQAERAFKARPEPPADKVEAVVDILGRFAVDDDEARENDPNYCGMTAERYAREILALVAETYSMKMRLKK